MVSYPVLFLLLAASCATKRAEWRDFTTPVVPFEEAWTAVLDKATLNGFVSEIAGDESTDRGLRVFHSRWIAREYGFRMSKRRRLHVEFASSTAQPGGWVIRYRVEQQQISDIARSMNPEEDDWKPDGQDRDAEDRIAAQVRLQLGMPFRGGSKG